MNVGIYVYRDNIAAAGYSVQIDDSKITSDANGAVGFPQVDVTAHTLRITSPEGEVSSIALSMSSGGSTGLGGTADGTVNISVAEGAQVIYLVANFAPGQPLEIASVTETQPAPPVQETVRPEGTFSVTSEFVDEEGKAVVGLGIQVTPEGIDPYLGLSDKDGRFRVDMAGFGRYSWAMANVDDLEHYAAVGIEFVVGMQTSILAEVEGGYQVETPQTTTELYMKFRQSGGTYILEEVSDSIPSTGLSPLIIGIIAVVVIVVVVFVILLVLRNRKKKQQQGRGTIPPRPRGTNGGSGGSGGGTGQSGKGSGTPPSKRTSTTGGTNKYSDKSKL